MQNIATLAAVTVSPTDPNAADLSAALNQRLTANLDGQPGAQTITDIETDLAGAQTSLKAAQDRHQQTSATLSDFLSQIEGVSNEQVGADILSLADPPAGLDADDRDAVPDQSGQLPEVAAQKNRGSDPRFLIPEFVGRLRRARAARPPARG